MNLEKTEAMSTTSASIQKVQRKCKSLPADYLEWIVENKGGKVPHNELTFEEEGRVANCRVNWIYGYPGPDWADLIYCNDTLTCSIRGLYKKWLAIADDSFGNQILLNLSTGEVLFWNHETHTTSHLAPSFAAFTGKLEVALSIGT